MKTRKVYSPEEFERFKNVEIMPYQPFKNMDREQQAELLTHYEKQFTPAELAELWGVKKAVIYATRSRLVKEGYLAGKDKKEPEKEEAAIVDPAPKEKEKYIASSPKREVQKVLPLEYIQQYQEAEPVSIMDPTGEDMNVSLEEFMRMLEIQEKMARMMEEQQRQKNHDGFSFKFKGDFTSQELTKRLNKILAIIEDEPNKYAVKFELFELEAEEEESEPEKGKQAELLEEVNELQENMKQMQFELDKAKRDKWKAGYSSFQTKKKGLHHPRSEYEKTGDFTGKIEKDGKTLYQTFYICTECNHKGKHYLEQGTVYCNCQDCGKRMRTRSSVKDELLTQDQFGNYFIAGKFKRADEIEQEKPLFEAFNA